MAFRAVVGSFSRGQGLWDLRNNGLFCDVFLRGSESTAAEISAHRAVLSARSPYFTAMFSSNMQESRQEHVQLHNIPGETLYALVKYIYTSEVSVDEANVVSLLEAAVFVDLEPLAAICWNYLGLRSDPGNRVLFYSLADLHQCSDLTAKAKTQVLRHFPEVAESEEFLQLEKPKVMALIGSEKINVKNEDGVLNAVFSWIRYDPAERIPMMAELVSLVRLAHVDPDQLQRSIAELIGQVRHCGDDLSDQVFQSVEDALCVESQARESCEFVHVLVGFHDKVNSIDPRTGVVTVLGDLPDGLQVTGVAVVERDAFVLGIVIVDDRRPALYRFKLDLGTWTRLAAPRSPHEEGSVIAIAGRLYAVGDRDGRSWNNGSTVECYDPATNLWQLRATLPMQLYRFGFAVHQGCLFTFGGLGPYAESVNRYDPQTDVWTECCKMPAPRFDCSACLGDDGIIYVSGGKASDYDQCYCCGPDTPLAKTFDAYDPRTNEWLNRGDLPFPGCGIPVTAVGGYVYVLGTYAGTASWEMNIYAYDEITHRWSMNPACSPPRFDNSACALVRFNKTLLWNYPVQPHVVVEGETDNDVDDSVAEDGDQWRVWGRCQGAMAHP